MHQRVDSTRVLQEVHAMLFDNQNFSTTMSSEVSNEGKAYGVVCVVAQIITVSVVVFS
jgi:hypothetical protein